MAKTVGLCCITLAVFNKRDKKRIAALEVKLKAKNKALSGLMEEHVSLKKALVSFKGHLGASPYPG